MKDNRSSNLISILILIVVAGAAYYIVQTVQQATQQTVVPFQQANNDLQTQVSNLLHPTPTIIPDPVTYINQIQALARLETIQYSIEQVVEADFNQLPPSNPLAPVYNSAFGNKILCQVHGTVIAGIDMQNIQPGDLQFQNGVLTVKLPPAEIFGDPNIDESKTVIYPLQTGIAVTRPDPNQAVQCLVGASDKIKQAALDDGILKIAQQNAQAYLIKFFAALGYPNTIFQVTPVD